MFFFQIVFSIFENYHNIDNSEIFTNELNDVIYSKIFLLKQKNCILLQFFYSKYSSPLIIFSAILVL